MTRLASAVGVLDCDGVAYCKNCFEKNVYFCEECHIPVPKRSENRYRVVNSRMILCRECYDKNYASCNICEKHKRKTEITFVRERALNYCDECLAEEDIGSLARCDTCHEANEIPVENSFEVLHDGTTMCKVCLLKETDKKQLFLEFPVIEERRPNLWGNHFADNNIVFNERPIRRGAGLRLRDIAATAELERAMQSVPRYEPEPPPPPEAPEPNVAVTEIQGQTLAPGTENPFYRIQFNMPINTTTAYEWAGQVDFGRVVRQEQQVPEDPVMQENPVTAEGHYVNPIAPIPWEWNEPPVPNIPINEIFLPEDLQHK